MNRKACKECGESMDIRTGELSWHCYDCDTNEPLSDGRISKEELLQRLSAIPPRLLGGNPEQNHAMADRLLLDFIGDKDVEKAFLAVGRWYS